MEGDTTRISIRGKNNLVGSWQVEAGNDPRPFHEEDDVGASQPFFKTEVRNVFWTLQTVGVHVDELADDRVRGNRVGLQDGKRRASDGFGNPEGFGNTLNKRRLAAPEAAFEQNHFPAPEHAGEIGGNPFGFFGRM